MGEGREMGGKNTVRLERLLEASNKDFEYVKRELAIAENKLKESKEECDRTDMKKKDLEVKLRLKEEVIENNERDLALLKKNTEKLNAELAGLQHSRENDEDELTKLRGVDSRLEIMRERIKSLENVHENDISEMESLRRELNNS